LAKHVPGMGEGGKVTEDDEVEVEPLLSMLVWQGRSLPSNAVTQEQLFEEWKEAGRRRMAALDAPARRQAMLDTFHVEWPAEVVSERHGEEIVLSRAGRGDRVPGVWIEGKGAPTLVVDPDGVEAARRDPRVAELIHAGRPVLLVDVFQTGKAAMTRDMSGKFFLTFNASDDANRVQDILTALAFLDARKAGKPAVLGIGKAGVWAMFARWMAPVDVTLSGDVESFAGTDEAFVKNLFVPGVQLVAPKGESMAGKRE